MERDMWIDSCRVRIIPWIDGEHIYCNVRYYQPGQSIEKDPVWDKTVYITDNEAGRRLVSDYIHSLVDYISSIKIDSGTKVVLTA